jgi:hypothetical protein
MPIIDQAQTTDADRRLQFGSQPPSQPRPQSLPRLSSAGRNAISQDPGRRLRRQPGVDRVRGETLQRSTERRIQPAQHLGHQGPAERDHRRVPACTSSSWSTPASTSVRCSTSRTWPRAAGTTGCGSSCSSSRRSASSDRWDRRSTGRRSNRARRDSHDSSTGVAAIVGLRPSRVAASESLAASDRAARLPLQSDR